MDLALSVNASSVPLWPAMAIALALAKSGRANTSERTWANRESIPRKTYEDSAAMRLAFQPSQSRPAAKPRPRRFPRYALPPTSTSRPQENQWKRRTPNATQHCTISVHSGHATPQELGTLYVSHNQFFVDVLKAIKFIYVVSEYILSDRQYVLVKHKQSQKYVCFDGRQLYEKTEPDDSCEQRYERRYKTNGTTETVREVWFKFGKHDWQADERLRLRPAPENCNDNCGFSCQSANDDTEIPQNVDRPNSFPVNNYHWEPQRQPKGQRRRPHRPRHRFA